MAIVGDAYVRIHAMTTGFGNEVARAVDDLGTRMKNVDLGSSMWSGATRDLSAFQKESLNTYNSINELITKSYYLQAAIGALLPVLSSAVSGLFALGAQAAAAGPALIALPGALAGIAQAFVTAKLAFSGVGKAIGALNKQKTGGGVDKMTSAVEKLGNAQRQLFLANRRVEQSSQALKDAQDAARESLQQLQFQAEGAAISEKRAAINLEKARKTLARVQDLPPNSRARQEAELAFQEADLAYREATDRNKDLAKEVDKRNALGIDGSKEVVSAQQSYNDALYEQTKAIKNLAGATKELNDLKSGKGGGGGADPLAGLSTSAAKFAKFIAKLKPEFDSLKSAAGEGMFAGLETGIKRLVEKLFPTLRDALSKTGSALGDLADGLSKTITSKTNMENLNTVLGMNLDTVKKLEPILSNLWTILLQLFAAADPLVRRFTDWIETLTDGWKAAHDTKEEMDGLRQTLQTAGDIAAQFGRSFGNLFGGLINLGKAASGAGSGGEMIANSFEEATKRFKDFTSAGLKDGSLQEFFKTASANFLKLMGIIGKIIKAFLGMGDDKGTGDFLDSLSEAVDKMIPGIERLTESAPAFGNFISKFAGFTAAFMESGSIKMFFGVLAKGFGVLEKIFSAPMVGHILAFTGAFHGARMGMKVFGSGIGTVAKFFVGDFLNLGKNTKTIGKFADDIYSAGLKMPLLGNATASLSGSLEMLFPSLVTVGGGTASMVIAFGLLLAAIAAVIAVLVIMWKKSETFREAVMNLVHAVGDALYGAFDTVRSAITEVLKPLGGTGGFLEVFKIIGDILGLTIIPLLQFTLVAAIGIVGDVFGGLVRIIGGGLAFIVQMIMVPFKLIGAFITLFTDGPKAAMGKFLSIFAGFGDSLRTMFRGIMEIVLSPIRAAFNLIIDLWNNTVGKLHFKAPKWLGGWEFKAPTIQKWEGIPKAAKGGIVFPSSGGSLVNVAEAGRPERIEPLDSDGLSKRDKAMIKMLSGTNGGSTFNIYPSAGMDEVELASLVNRQIAFQLRRGAA